MKILIKKFFGAFLLVILTIIGVDVNGQSVNVTTVVTPPFPIYLENVMSFDFNTIVTLTNLKGKRERIKLIARLNGDNGVKAIIKASYRPLTPILLPANGTLVLTKTELKRIFANIKGEDISIEGVERNTIFQTEKLPEGIYQLCIQALDYDTGEEKSSASTGCTSIFITDYDPPVITNPTAGQWLKPLSPQSVIVNWTPTGQPQFTRYKFEMVDMTLNKLQDPNDAFINIGVILHYKKEGIIQNNYYYDINHPKLIEKHQYALRVTAYDPMKKLSFKNGGRSEVIAFRYQEKKAVVKKDKKISGGGNIQFSMNACQELNGPSDKAPVKDVKEYDVLKIGDHKLRVFDINWSGNKLSGEGKIINSYFKTPVLVSFKDLTVNKSHEVISGTAVARNDNNVPSEWVSELGDVDFQGGDIANLLSNLMNKNDRIIEYPYSNADSIGLGMPIGINRKIAGADQMIAIVGMQFGVKGAGLNAVAQISFPSYGKDVQLAATSVCFNKDGFTKDAFLHLVKDYTINPNGKVRVKLDKGEEGDPPTGTYVIMESKGFKEAQLEGEVQVDKTIAKPVEGLEDEEGNPIKEVKGTFSITVEDPSNFIVEDITITPFQITKFPGFEVSVNSVNLDMSDKKNPAGIHFPLANYNKDGNLWKGFYLKSCDVKLPDKLQKNAHIQASDFVIDKKGFSGIMEVPKVFDTEKGRLGTKKWKWSMKNFYVKIIENSINTAKFDGDIRVPITKDNTYLKYDALITKDGNELNYNITLVNQEDIPFPAIIAKGEIAPETRIDLNNTGNGFEPAFHFYGNLEFNRKFALDVQGFPLSLDSVIIQDLIVDKEGVGLGQDGAISFSYDAKQRQVNGFDINIDTFYIQKKNEFNFAISIDLLGENNSVGATAGFKILTKYEDKSNMMRLDKVKLTEIAIEGDISVAKIKGALKIMEDDPVYGDGFDGSLKVTLNLGENGEGINAGASLHTIFGRMPAKQNVKSYKYFFFKGEFFIESGIPISASLRLRGLQGGMYLNMVQDDEDYSAPPVPFKGDNEDTKFGIIAGVDIGLADAKAFHAKPKFIVQFGTKSGLDLIAIHGEAYVMTAYQQTFEPYGPGTSPVMIQMEAKMNFKKKLFEFNSIVDVQYPFKKKPFISAHGGIEMMVQGKNKKDPNSKISWFIKMGVPNDKENISVNIANLFTKQHYFMAGNGLPGMPPVPQEILEKLPKKYSSQRNDDVENSTALKFAFGSQFSFQSKDLEAWIFYAKFDILFGYDLMIQKNYNTITPCGFGKNYWYVRGQAYGKFAADIGIHAKMFGKERRFSLVYVDVAALVQVGLPNPSGIQAVIKGEASFMGVIEGEFEFEADQGEICQPSKSPLDALNDLKYIQDVVPTGNKISVFANPEVSLLFSGAGKSYTLDEVVGEGTNKLVLRFPVKTMRLTVADKNSPLNGKVIADMKSYESFDGQFKFEHKGERIVYEADKILPGKTRFKLEIEIEPQELVKGRWKVIKGITKNSVRKIVYFKTKKAPDHIVKNNIYYMYPMNGQRYYLQDDINYSFIKLKKGQDNLFDGSEEGEIKIRFIPIKGGNTIKGKYLGYSDNVIKYTHDKLVNGGLYVCQIYRHFKPKSGKDAQSGGNKLGKANFNHNISKRFKLIKQTKLTGKDILILEFVFGVSKYNKLPQKLAKMTLIPSKSTIACFNNGMLSVANAKFKALEEGFDLADIIHMKAQWFVGGSSLYNKYKTSDAGYTYYQNYLKPELYIPLKKYVSTKFNVSSNTLELDRGVFIDHEPLISQKEINKILKQKAYPGLQLKLAPSSKIVNMRIDGVKDAHEDYNKFVSYMWSPDILSKPINMSKAEKEKYKELSTYVKNWRSKPHCFKYMDMNKTQHILMLPKGIMQNTGPYMYVKVFKLSKKSNCKCGKKL